MLRQPQSQAKNAFTEPTHRIGDIVWERAREFAAVVNDAELLTTLRNRKLSRDRYLAFIAAMYPCVVGFNRALIRSIAKVDHVRQSGLVKALAEQLQEEQDHNQMWRRMLTAYEIDHEEIYRTLVDYMTQFSQRELDRMTKDVLAALTEDLRDVSPGCFPDPVFPEPVLALYHHLYMTGTHDDVHYWEHFASQSSMEVIIYDIVSTSIFPGVVGNPELDAGAESTQWWAEHAKQGSEVMGKRTDEEKHLQLAQIALNRSATAESLKTYIASRAEDTMRLFTATLLSQDKQYGSFPIERYLKS
jgi:hypothetical protein